MGFQRVLVACLLITTFSGVISQEDPKCETPMKFDGFCVSIERCRNIHSIVTSPTPPPRGVQNYINRAACTQPGVARSVCCQPLEIIPKPVTTTTTSTTTTRAPPVEFSVRTFTRPVMTVGVEPDSSTTLDWSLLPTMDCGIMTINRIANGNATRVFEYPWMVLLLYTSNGRLEDGCGGSLINNRYVLTAAHCIKTRSTFVLTKVRLGEHDKLQHEDCHVYSDGETDCADPAIDVDIESTVVHKNYGRPSRFFNDIGLIRMAREVEFTDSIKPICLPVNEALKHKVLNKYIVTGWGTTQRQSHSDVLMQAIVYHVAVPECLQKLSAQMPRLNLAEEWHVCAAGDELVDACHGDSGGPLGYTVDTFGARFVQFGIVCSGVKSCGQLSFPGIYTRVTGYMDWIVANMKP